MIFFIRIKEQGTVVVHGDEMVSYSPNDFVENDEDDDSLDEQDDLSFTRFGI